MSLIPVIPSFIRAAPSAAFIGTASTTGDGFPSGNISLPSGRKVIVVCCDLAGSPAASNVTLGGVPMNFACGTDTSMFRSASVWYLETEMTGLQMVTGSGGSGRAVFRALSITGYSNPNPYASAIATINSQSVGVALDTSTNSAVVGAGTGGFQSYTITADRGPEPVIQASALEAATAHFNWHQTPTSRGPTTYTANGTSADGVALAAAAWR